MLDMNLRLAWVFGCVVALGSGCESGDGDDVGMSGTDGGGASSGSSEGSSSGSSETTEEDSSSCVVPVSEADEPAPVAIRIENTHEFPIFIQDFDCPNAAFEIEAPAGVDGIAQPSCGLTCSEVDGPSPECGCGGCPPTAWRINPGGTLEVSWDSEVWRLFDVPEGCLCSSEGRQCRAPEPAPAGIYTVSVRAYQSEEDCGVDCECDPGEEACFLGIGSPPLAATLPEVTAELSYPDMLEVVLTPG